MSVDLSDTIENLRREVSPPGSDSFPDATDDMYLGYLQDAFWEARLDGVTALASFNQDDGIISPVTVGGTDITGDLVQLLVMYGGIRILRNQLINMGTGFRAKAGPAEFETSNSGQMMTAVLNELRDRRNIILTRLSDVGAIPSYYIDALISREESLYLGTTYWPSSGYGGVNGGGYGSYGTNSWGGW